MKIRYIAAFVLALLLPVFFLGADNPVATIPAISKNEFELIKNPVIGQIVLVRDNATLYYYNGKYWMALKGECFPEPKSPKIDSIVASDDNLLIYFNDTNKATQQYIIKNMNDNEEYVVKDSPAKISTNIKKDIYNFAILGKNDCGISGPSTSKNIEIK